MTGFTDKIPVGPGSPIQVPGPFADLYALAHNMWWSWDAQASDLWSRVDPRRWSESRSPLSLLSTVELETWAALERSDSFVTQYREVTTRFRAYMAEHDTWYQRTYAPQLDDGIAYLSAEFGVHSTLPFYSGGLGVLAGDHAKAASDLGLPLIGVGLFYRRGYFRQEVDHEGDQQHHYHHIELSRRPVRPIVAPNGLPLRIPVEMPGRTVHLGVWRVDVGRVPLLLLDSDIPENSPADRPMTHILYVRGREMRLNQELLLGIGGVRLLKALSIEPAVWHINEGHAGFSFLERMGDAVAAGASVDAVAAELGKRSIFTLHTPVPAGNEVFDSALVRDYADDAFPRLAWEEVVPLAKVGDDPAFNLSGMCIRLAQRTNGVSAKHAQVATEDWGELIGGPALAITNGVHIPTWLGTPLRSLFTRVIGANWTDRLLDEDAWKAVYDIEDQDLWSAHGAQKEIMAGRLRDSLLEQSARQGAAPGVLRDIGAMIPADRLTIVFARRFASYKRAWLLFSDRDRLYRLLSDLERPVQVVFAGKAHPADREGQALIREVVQCSQDPAVTGHIFFIEDYDMDLARALVTGADVWLNTPRPPMEASGTSGMKVAANAGLNLSVLDGWWIEGCNGRNGWGFGGEGRSDGEDAAELYDLLENEVIPLFYDRGPDGLPREWLQRMKEALATLLSPFSASRMVAQYTTEGYIPLLGEDG